jgi:hypothetical protein
MEEEKVIDKITKLLTKAESTTPEEAELLTAKASELMVAWAIDEAVIAERRGLSGKPDEIIEHVVHVSGSYWKAHQMFGCDVGRGFGFRMIITNWPTEGAPSGSKGTFRWIGFESEIRKAELLYASLQIQCARALHEFTLQPNFPRTRNFKLRRDFIIGFGSMVGTRLGRQRRDAEKAAAVAEEKVPAAATPESDAPVKSVALVLSDRKERLRDYYDTRYGRLKGRASSLQIGNGYNAGSAAGARADLGGSAVGGSRRALNK